MERKFYPTEWKRIGDKCANRAAGRQRGPRMSAERHWRIRRPRTARSALCSRPCRIVCKTSEQMWFFEYYGGGGGKCEITPADRTEYPKVSRQKVLTTCAVEQLNMRSTPWDHRWTRHRQPASSGFVDALAEPIKLYNLNRRGEVDPQDTISNQSIKSINHSI